MNKLVYKLGEKTAKVAKNVGIKSAFSSCWFFAKQPKFPKGLDKYRKH